MLRKILSLTLSTALSSLPALVQALPQDGVVAEGAAMIDSLGKVTTVNQASERAVLDWQSFNIAADELVKFEQPSAQSMAVNRVNSGGASEILGQLQANGTVLLLNPNGVVFGQGSQVDVGGLVATTANIDNAAFMQGDLNFNAAGSANASIVNDGNITVAEAGLVALVAPTVQNNGTIVARLGKVALGAGDTFTLDLYGDQLVQLSVQDPTLQQALLEHKGTIEAQGGAVLLTAGQAGSAVQSVLNVDGIVAANSVDTADGRIVLNAPDGKVKLGSTAVLDASGAAGGGDIFVGGTAKGEADFELDPTHYTTIAKGAVLTADATQNGDGGQVIVWADKVTRFSGEATAKGGSEVGDGGFLEISGKDTLLFRGDVNAGAQNGERGTVLFDPINITITDGSGGADDAEVTGDGDVDVLDTPAGSFTISEQALEGIAASTNITLEATNNITINDLTDNSLSLATTGAVTILADVDNSGAGDFTMNTGDTIVTDGGNLTISGQNVTLGEINTSSSADGNIIISGNTQTNLGGDITTNDGNIFLNGPTTLIGNVAFTAGAGDATLAFNDDLSGDYTFSITAGSGPLTFYNVDIDTLSIVTGGDITLYGTITTDTTQDYTSAGIIGLNANAGFTAYDGVSSYGNVTFDTENDINGAYNLTIVGDTVTLPALGNATPVGIVDVTGQTAISLLDTVDSTGTQTYAGNTTLSGGTFTTTGDNFTITGDVTLGADASINTGSSSAGNIAISGGVDGAYALTAEAGTGSVSIGGAVGGTTPLTSMDIDGAAGITIADGAITTGAQDYADATSIGGIFQTTNNSIDFNDDVTLTAATVVTTGSGAGNIAFDGTVDGAYDLSVDAGTGTTTFSGIVGGVTPLEDIVAAGSAVALQTINATGSQSFSGALTLDGDINVTAGPIDLTGDVTLGTDVVLTSGGGASDAITISGDVNGDYILEIVAGLGDISMGNIDVDTLTLTSGDDLTFGGTLLTDSAQDFTNIDDIITSGDATFTAQNGTDYYDITFDSANSLTASGAVAFTGDTITLYDMSGITTLTVTGQTAINLNSSVSSSGSQSYSATNISLGGATYTTSGADLTMSGAIALSADTILTTGTGAGDLTLGAIDGAYNLDLIAGAGDIVVSGNIGGTTPLTTLDATAANMTFQNVTTTGDQNYTGTVLDTGLLSGGDAIAMVGDVTLGGGVTTSNGDISIDGNVTLSADSIIQSGGTSADTVEITGDISGDYDLEFAAGDANITLGGTSIDVDDVTFTSGGQLSLAGGTFTVDQALDFTNIGNVVLSGNTVITAQDGSTPSDITFGSANTITGNYDLTFNAGVLNLYQVGVSPGHADNIANLTVNATAFYLNGAVYTDGEQDYNSLDGLANNLATNGADITFDTDLVLLGDVDLSTGSGAGDISFNGRVDGAYSLSANSGTGTITIADEIGGITPLISVVLIGNNFSLAGVYTTGNQNYTGDTTLDGQISSIGGDITFNDQLTLVDTAGISTAGGDINLLDNVYGNEDLTLDAGSGDILFAAAAGTANTRLGTLTIANGNDLTFTEGVYVTDYIDNSTGTLTFGYDPGLDSLGGITIDGASNLTGRVAGTSVVLNADYMNVEVDVDSLTIGGTRSTIVGSIGGETGRRSAAGINFLSLTGGPHFVNGFNVPLVEIYTSPQVMNTTQLADNSTSQPVTLQTTQVARNSLNPFTADHSLLTQDDTGLGIVPDMTFEDDDTDNSTFGRLFDGVEL